MSNVTKGRILPDLAAMQARIAELEAANAALAAKGSSELSIVLGDYNGSPVLQFTGGGIRPFNIGVSKVSTILKNVPEIEPLVKQAEAVKAAKKAAK